MSTARALPKDLPLVIVTWVDAFGDEEQIEDDDLEDKEQVVHTVGFIVRRDKRAIVLAAERIEPLDAGCKWSSRGRTTIPVALIRKITRARV